MSTLGLVACAATSGQVTLRADTDLRRPVAATITPASGQDITVRVGAGDSAARAGLPLGKTRVTFEGVCVLIFTLSADDPRATMVVGNKNCTLG